MSTACITSVPATAPLCLVAGVGPGIGAALVRKFASHGFVVLMLARSAPFLSDLSASLLALSPPSFAIPFPTDLTSSTSLSTTFKSIQATLPSRAISVLIFNAGQRRLRAQPIDSISTAEMQRFWAINALAFHSLVREVLPDMRRLKTGTVLVTGATGGVRSTAGFASFSASKWALRAMVGCLAKEVALAGDHVHVAHVIVDAAVDTPLIRGYVDRQQGKQKQSDDAEPAESSTPSTAAALGGRRVSSVVLSSPDDIAETYWQLHCQPPSAWTLELDLRPWNEPITARL